MEKREKEIYIIMRNTISSEYVYGYSDNREDAEKICVQLNRYSEDSNSVDYYHCFNVGRVGLNKNEAKESLEPYTKYRIRAKRDSEKREWILSIMSIIFTQEFLPYKEVSHYQLFSGDFIIEVYAKTGKSALEIAEGVLDSYVKR